MTTENSKQIHKRRPATHGGQEKPKKQEELSRRAKTQRASCSVLLAKTLLFVVAFAYLMVSFSTTYTAADLAFDLSSVKGIGGTQQSQSVTHSTEIAREQSSPTPPDKPLKPSVLQDLTLN